MPELRRDPLLRRWVIMAAERGHRPNEFAAMAEPRVEVKFCPFCEGNESKTPPEIYAVRPRGTPANTPGWKVRVVPNKYPALRIEGGLDKRANGLYDRMNGVGAHEVIIERPDHGTTITDLTDEHLADTIWAYKQRLIDLARDARFTYGMIFKNVGRAAGASLEHSHSQLIVTSVLPIRLTQEIEGARHWSEIHERNIFDDIIHQELGDEKRVVLDTPRYLAFCPYASRFPFETWIVPKFTGSRFERIEYDQGQELAWILRRVLRKIEGTLPDVPYNYILHSGPYGAQEMPYFTWHIEIIPRLTRIAGFEWGTGMYINPTLPEDAAEFLRKADAG
jgi:UDPglucose--hexose-1-phosphate uridylyltransferase